MTVSPASSRWIFLAALVAVLFVAAGLRLYQLPERPLGLHYDEAANGILAGEIARGLKTPIFIASYTGKEVLFFYWAALWMKLCGVTPWALRLSAALIGVATVAATVWAGHELLQEWADGRWIALTAAAALAVSFWHIVLSRYGFRAITQPLLQALTVAALWRGFRQGQGRQRPLAQMMWPALAGLFCGLTAYTYLAARAFPIPLAAALAALLVTDRHKRKQRLVQTGVFVAVAALVLTPLARYWYTHPGSFMVRARQVAADNWAEAWRGWVACLKMFFWEGDPYIRFNVPGRPLFGPPLAVLFVVGLGAGLYRLVRVLRSSEDEARSLSVGAGVFLFVLLPVMLLPSALATDEITPSNLRTVGLLPFVYVFPALGLWTFLGLLRPLYADRSSVKHVLLPAAGFLLLVTMGVSVASSYLAWASSPSLYYAADGDLSDAADYLSGADLSSTTPYVASQHYRHPTLAFLSDDYEAVRWLVGGQTLAFPPSGNALYLMPRSASDDLAWMRSMLSEDSFVSAPPGPDGSPAFYVYRSRISEAPAAPERRSVNLGHVVRFLGYGVTNQPQAGETADIALWWKVTGSPEHPDYRAVARLHDRWGSVWGTRQPSHYPSEQWTEGELIIDHLSVPIEPGAPPGEYAVRFGLYAPGADTRLPVLDESGAYAGLYTEIPIEVARAATPPSTEEMGIQDRIGASLDGLTLLGASVNTKTARPGERLHATLFWRVGNTAPPSHRLSLRLGGRTLYEGGPVHDTYPFSEWRPQEVVADRYSPRLPLDMPAGTHPLRIQIGDQGTLDLGNVTVQATDRIFEVPPISHPVTATLSDRVELLGYDLSSDSPAAGETLTLTLTWRALTDMVTDYTVFTHLEAPDGSMVGQRDQQPREGTYPTSLWARGEVVTDVYRIPIDAAAPPGEHRLKVGMYTAEDGIRLSIENDEDNAVTLQTISVAE